MAKAVPPDTITAWFTEYQKNHIVKDGVIPTWFHGIISRKQAEEMLMTKPPGHFLIRVSESRIGCTLSYRAENVCRHFMIDMLPGDQCEIVGEKLRHSSLHDLVAFHRRTPIHPFTELLIVACDQACQNISEDTPPALPPWHRVPLPLISSQNLSISSDVSVSPPRLYPSLERELRALNLDNVGSPLNLAPQPRAKLILTPPEITTRWRSALKNGEQACHQRKSADKVLPRINLIQCRKIFKKKKNHSDEHNQAHTYVEINEAMTEPAESQTVTNGDHQEVDGVSGELPVEYLNPPPFAPGY